jgi:hypothetical protein
VTLPFMAGSRNRNDFVSPAFPQDRLIRKEEALGMLREIVPPQDHIGIQLVPWLEVASDDVIFDYAVGLAEGMAPARAEDAESELAQKDVLFAGQGRAAVIDWALKDHYNASDVNRYQEILRIVDQIQGGNLPLEMSNILGDFQATVTRDDALRRKKLDNRIEWLIMTGLSDAGISYNDGRIKFTVDFGRPAGQVVTKNYSTTSHDPIGDILRMQEFMFDQYGIRMDRAITSRRVINTFMNSDRFLSRSGFVVGGTPSSTIDPNYVLDGWGPNAALELVKRATNVDFIEYDSVYRTRPVGSKITTVNRFLPENRIIFLPNQEDVNSFDETQIGFGKTLTSPHPEGNWTAGYYEWEKETGPDPWGRDRGTGVKAFPVLPHMDLTAVFDITLPAASSTI